MYRDYTFITSVTSLRIHSVQFGAYMCMSHNIGNQCASTFCRQIPDPKFHSISEKTQWYRITLYIAETMVQNGRQDFMRCCGIAGVNLIRLRLREIIYTKYCAHKALKHTDLWCGFPGSRCNVLHDEQHDGEGEQNGDLQPNLLTRLRRHHIHQTRQQC